MVEGLPVFKKWAYHRIQVQAFFLGKIETGTGFASDSLIFLLCFEGIIKVLLQRAFISFETSIAYIWRF